MAKVCAAGVGGVGSPDEDADASGLSTSVTPTVNCHRALHPYDNRGANLAKRCPGIGRRKPRRVPECDLPEPSTFGRNGQNALETPAFTQICPLHGEFSFPSEAIHVSCEAGGDFFSGEAPIVRPARGAHTAYLAHGGRIRCRLCGLPVGASRRAGHLLIWIARRELPHRRTPLFAVDSCRLASVEFRARDSRQGGPQASVALLRPRNCAGTSARTSVDLPGPRPDRRARLRPTA